MLFLLYKGDAGTGNIYSCVRYYQFAFRLCAQDACTHMHVRSTLALELATITTNTPSVLCIYSAMLVSTGRKAAKQ